MRENTNIFLIACVCVWCVCCAKCIRESVPKTHKKSNGEGEGEESQPTTKLTNKQTLVTWKPARRNYWSSFRFDSSTHCSGKKKLQFRYIRVRSPAYSFFFLFLGKESGRLKTINWGRNLHYWHFGRFSHITNWKRRNILSQWPRLFMHCVCWSLSLACAPVRPYQCGSS